MDQQICIICETTFSRKQKIQISTQMESLFDIKFSSYPSTCPTCISTELSHEKDQYKANLIDAYTDMNQLHRAYLQASIKHEKLKSSYNELDRKASFIPFFLKQESATNKTRKQKRVKRTAKIQSDIVTTLLKMLTPEQQALVVTKCKQF